MNPWLLDDSDSQWAALEAERTRVDRISRRYWRAIPAAERERIAAAIPDGYQLHVFPGYRAKPGVADIQLRTNDNAVVRGSRGYVTAALCWAVIGRVEAVA